MLPQGLQLKLPLILLVFFILPDSLALLQLAVRDPIHPCTLSIVIHALNCNVHFRLLVTVDSLARLLPFSQSADPIQHLLLIRLCHLQ